MAKPRGNEGARKRTYQRSIVSDGVDIPCARDIDSTAANMPEIPDTSNSTHAPTLTKINCTSIAEVGSS